MVMKIFILFIYFRKFCHIQNSKCFPFPNHEVKSDLKLEKWFVHLYATEKIQNMFKFIPLKLIWSEQINKIYISCPFVLCRLFELLLLEFYLFKFQWKCAKLNIISHLRIANLLQIPCTVDSG